MKKDNSKEFYDLYFSRSDKKLEITLKNGHRFLAYITGYYKGREDSNDTYIMRWHVLESEEKRMSFSDDLDTDDGQVINHADIDHVRFCSDNTLVKF